MPSSIDRLVAIGRPALVPVALAGLLCLASCEPTPRKSDYVGARIAIECEGRSGEEFRSCRIEVIKRYMDVPLREMQERFPSPAPDGRRLGCSR